MPDESSFSNQPDHSTKNHILSNLPSEDYERLLPDLEPVKLVLGQFLYRAEETINQIYFPDDAMISVVANTMTGQSAEIGVIGHEGLIGLDALMGSETTPHDNLVQHASGAMRINLAPIKEEFKRGGALHASILNFARLLMVQIGQTALCNRLHTVEERLARWLLLCRDRTGTDRLQLTQEFLSLMLGTNRATVTVSAIALQSAGYIRYTRGRIFIKDGEGLEDFACECYRVVKKEYDRPPSY